MRVLVLGYLVRGPLGGYAWSALQYLIGLRSLGHDVYFFEDSGEDESCYDPRTTEMTTDASFGLRFAATTLARYGFEERWAYFDVHTSTWLGPCASRADELCRTADACLNMSGVNALRESIACVPIRAFVDMDPAFTQIRHLTDPVALRAALQHNAFLTFGENAGRPDCSIPDDGIDWLPTRHPIALGACPRSPGRNAGRFTTVMQWQSYPDRSYRDARYGAKSASFGPYVDLPQRTGAPLELAIGSGSAPRDQLKSRGWIVSDPYEASKDVPTYLDFIRRSKAEFTVAKHGYVATASGWFSERSATYLAMGRPVVTQETGFTGWLRSDGGVLAFRTSEEAVEAIQRVNGDYERQCVRARAVAADYFDARGVLAALLATATEAATGGRGAAQEPPQRYAPVAQMDRAGDS